jgi:hypothetical protein
MDIAKGSLPTLVLRGLDLDDEYPVLALNRYVELLYRKPIGLALVRSLHCSDMLRSPTPDDFDAPSLHRSSPLLAVAARRVNHRKVSQAQTPSRSSQPIATTA